MPKTRQLAAIMFTDIVGYTTLMGKDEDAAFAALETNRELHKRLIENHNGKWLKEMGDGTLSSFTSVSDAVHCAVAIQETCCREGKFKLRIGIHQGEVIVEQNDVFGDGVNIASRIESIAPPDSIYVSETVARNLDNKPGIETRFIGEHKLKNVQFPVRIYQIWTESLPGPAAPARSLPFKRAYLPYLLGGLLTLALAWFGIQNLGSSTKNIFNQSVAVLPFENLSPEEENAFFAAGVHEDILNKLAGVEDLKVISRTSVRRYRNFEGELSEVADNLEVRYVVEGSVFRMGDIVRVTARLVDAVEDKSTLLGEYEGGLEEVFDLQSNLAQEIASKLQAQLSRAEQDQLNQIPTQSPTAYDNYIQARTLLYGPFVSYRSLIKAAGHLETSVGADPKFAEAWSLLAQARSRAYEKAVQFEGGEEEAQLLRQGAADALEKTKKLDPGAAHTLRADGYYHYSVTGDQVKALASLDDALELFPNDSETLLFQAMIYMFMGQGNSAIDKMEKAYAIDNKNGMLNNFLPTAYDYTNRYADLVSWYEKRLEKEPEATHYLIEARYYDFLAKGSIEAYQAYEEAVRTINRDAPGCNLRAVQNNEMVVAMVNGEFKPYLDSWTGKWDSHHASHGNWSCPLILNEEANHARLMQTFGLEAMAERIVSKALQSTERPINDQSICIFNKDVYVPKLMYLQGDSIGARRAFESVIPEVLNNHKYARAMTERMVLVQAADMVAPDRVYELYSQLSRETASMVSMEKICADPWTYPNLLRTPEFLAEVKADGRFVEFLETYGLNDHNLFSNTNASIDQYLMVGEKDQENQ